MKKFILPALFMGAIAFGSTSCKKDYTCECTISGGGVSGTASATQNMSKKDAEAWCEESSTTSGSTTTTCTLK